MIRKTIPERKDTPDNHRWDLSPMFASDDEWNSLYSEIEKILPEYEKYRGKLGESAKTLSKAIDFTLETDRSIEKLYVYAHLKSDEDKSNQQYLGLVEDKQTDC